MTQDVSKQTDPDRFEISVDGRVAGFAQFVDYEGSRVFFHTEITEEFSGRGLAGAVVEHALQETRDQGLRIVPVCPLVKKWVADHDGWADAVDPVTPAMLAAIPRR